MKYKWLLLALLLTACEDNLPTLTEAGVSLKGKIDTRLGEPDENGYYHIKLGDKWQTIHRLSGLLWYEGLAELEPGEKLPAENVKVFWESSHYWELSDTLGYYVKRGLTDELVWVNYDTVYVTGFSGQEVPTINPASYSNSKGEFNTMFAPVKNMRGDTIRIYVGWYDLDDKDVINTFQIVCD